jgi:hypothetical protein
MIIEMERIFCCCLLFAVNENPMQLCLTKDFSKKKCFNGLLVKDFEKQLIFHGFDEQQNGQLILKSDFMMFELVKMTFLC